MWWMMQAAAFAGGSVVATVDVRGEAWAYVDGAGPLPDLPGTAEIHERGQVFLPGTLAVVQGTEVSFVNDGPDVHNVFSTSPAATFDVDSYQPHQVISRVFDTPGTVPVRCNRHREMRLDILVVPNVWFTKVDDKTKSFRIDGIEPGQHTVVVWTPYSEYRQQITVTEGGTYRFEYRARNSP